MKAKRGGAGVGPSPADPSKPDSNHHVVCDGAGLPLKVITTNMPDIAMAESLIAAIPPVAGRIGRPDRNPTRYWPIRATTRSPSEPISNDAAFWR